MLVTDRLLSYHSNSRQIGESNILLTVKQESYTLQCLYLSGSCIFLGWYHLRKAWAYEGLRHPESAVAYMSICR